MDEFIRELKSYSEKDRAMNSMRYFKTKEGQYGHGDLFLGVRVPIQRKVSKKYYKTISQEDIIQLLNSPYHEVRLATLFMLVLKYQKGNRKEQDHLITIYLNNTNKINNWDLVDSSAPYIVGHYCFHYQREDIIYKLSKSNNLWEERISILASSYFINQHQYQLTLDLCAQFLSHKHDLIHKACGWMLREIGKRDKEVLGTFLKDYSNRMPRTELRYAIEKFPKDEQQYWLKKDQTIY